MARRRGRRQRPLVHGHSSGRSPEDPRPRRGAAADVIVVGDRGHGLLMSLLSGSVSLRLQRIAPCPGGAFSAAVTSVPWSISPSARACRSFATAGSARRLAAGVSRCVGACRRGSRGLRCVQAEVEPDHPGREARRGGNEAAAARRARRRLSGRSDPGRRLERRRPDRGRHTRSGAFEGMLLSSVSHAVIHGAGSAVAVVGDGSV
jgi:hypothetical protein